MRRLALVLFPAIVIAAVSARAATPEPSAGPVPNTPAVSIFYYPWYGTAAEDGAYEHWAQYGHRPPDDIAAGFYPARGLYSSSDAHVVDAQLAEIAAAGVAEIVVSWWGTDSPENARLATIVSAARSRGLTVAIHLEPYPGRSAESTAADITYLRGLGVETFYLYQPQDLPAEDWAAMNAQLEGVTVYAQTGLVGFARKGGFAGLYTYDLLTYGASSIGRICSAARLNGLLCAPSVGPGYDARRGSGDLRIKLRRAGATYDSMWRAAIAAGADRVTITSYNEWHEGTQIEAATSFNRRGAYRYGTYDGAYGRRGLAAERAYLDRTAYWSRMFAASSLARMLFGR